jgi:GPH family glycoside/pentoside/hexuronide:cation symporter
MAMSVGIEGPKALIAPFYNIILGVNPALLGTILMLTRIWDAITDPIAGVWSDNHRSRWGRRRPFLLGGGIASALTFPLIWFVPADASDTFASSYLLVSLLVFYSAFTVFCVPYTAVAMEITPDYAERTRITATRALFGSATTVLINWTFAVAQADFFATPMEGIRALAIAYGILLLVTCGVPAFSPDDRFSAQIKSQPPQPLLGSLRVAVTNRPFQILMALTVLIVMGHQTFTALGIYINTYALFDGDSKRAAVLTGSVASLSFALGFIYVPLITAAARRWSKDSVLAVCLTSGMAGGAARWWIYDRDLPYLQLIEPFFLIPATVGFWVLVNSMKADVCDHDEWESGLRREGIYSSVSTWLQKMAVAATFSLTGLFLVAIGFQQADGGAQAPETLLGLRIAFSVMPVVTFGTGLILLRSYPLTGARMAGIRADLEARRGAV